MTSSALIFTAFDSTSETHRVDNRSRKLFYDDLIRLLHHSYWDKMLKVVQGGLNYLQSGSGSLWAGDYLGGEFSQSV